MNKKARKALRKLLKSHGVTVDVTPSQASEFVEATKAEVKYRELLKSKYKEIVQSTSESQIDSLSSRIYRRNVLSETEESSREILVVTIPIVQYAGDFHVHEGQGGSGGDSGRSCETRVEIIQYGEYLNKKVTKVLLKPITGRRHQLRVHMRALGHPIVGDASYNSEYDPQSPRMMLHAQKLAIEMRDSGGGHDDLQISTDDPFPFDMDGKLNPKLPSYTEKRLNTG